MFDYEVLTNNSLQYLDYGRFVISDLRELELLQAPRHVSDLLLKYPNDRFERIELTEETMTLAELAGRDSRSAYTILEYNTDLADIQNIERPERTEITNPTIDTSQLFRIWALDPDGLSCRLLDKERTLLCG